MACYAFNFTYKLFSSRIFHNFNPLFLFHSNVITYYSCQIFIVSVIMMSTISLVVDKWVNLLSRVIKIDITRKS